MLLTEYGRLFTVLVTAGKPLNDFEQPPHARAVCRSSGVRKCSEGLSWGCLSLTRCLSPELTSALPKSSQEHVRSWKVKRCMSRSSKVPRGWDKASMEGSGDKQAGQTHLEKSQRLL